MQQCDTVNALEHAVQPKRRGTSCRVLLLECMIQSGGGERRRAQAQAVAAVRALARGNVMPVVTVDLHLDVPGGDVL